jgi:hypothetical protein
MFFGNDTGIFFDPSTTLNTITGPINASQSPLPEVYATTSKAGFIQLAEDSVIRGALGASGAGISDRVAVSAAALARELNLRVENVISPGTGVSVVGTSIELPGGDPTDPSDNVISYAVSIGLPGSSDDVTFNGLRLGTSAQLVNSISTLVNKANTRATALITETALRTYSIGTDQIDSLSITTGLLANSSVTTIKIADLNITNAKLADNSVTTAKIVAGAVISDRIASSAVTSIKIEAGAITADKLSGGQGNPTYPIYGARGWITVNSNGVPFAGSGNMSCSRTGNGSYTVTITPALPNANYAVVLTARDGEGDHFAGVVDKEPGAFTIRTYDLESAGANSNDTPFDAVIFF